MKIGNQAPEAGQTARPPGVRSLQRGFSLLEVVVAFAILALTLGVLMQIFSRAMNTTVLSETYSRAATLAEARLNLVGLEIPLEAGAHSGDPEDGFEWEVQIEEYVVDELVSEVDLQPYLVTSAVSWETAEGTRRINLSSLYLGALP